MNPSEPMPDSALPAAALLADDTRRREELFKVERDELVRKQISNSENFDRAILTLSTAGFGVSITFMQQVVSHNAVQHHWLLLQSWGFFTIAIIATVASFMTSQSAIVCNLEFARKYYLERQDAYLTKTNPWSGSTNRLNTFAGIAFMAAIIWTAFFVGLNLLPFRP